MGKMRTYRVQVWYSIGTAGEYFAAKSFDDAYKKGKRHFKNYGFHQITVERMPGDFRG